MTEFDEKLDRSIELAKSGFYNAQERISVIDTKVGIAVGFLVVLLPAPLLVTGWLSGLEGNPASNIFSAAIRCSFASWMAALFLFLGMGAAFVALVYGFWCLTPRGPRGFEKDGIFHNEWRPNVLFPIHSATKSPEFIGHLRVLRSGIDRPFVMAEFEHQLQQLGWIMNEKFAMMRKCFKWMGTSMAFYGLAVLFAAWVIGNAVLHTIPKT